MGYRSMYEDRDKLFNTSPEEKPVNQRDAKRRLDGLFSGPKKEGPKTDRCVNGHNWVEHRDGPIRCSRCKTPKPPGPAS